MKKLILTIAMVAGMSAFAFAQNPEATEENKENTEQSTEKPAETPAEEAPAQ